MFGTTSDQMRPGSAQIFLDDLPKTIKNPAEPEYLLHLRGIVDFAPYDETNFAEGGHYTALCFRFNSWYRYNDLHPTFGLRRPEAEYVSKRTECRPALLLYFAQ